MHTAVLQTAAQGMSTSSSSIPAILTTARRDVPRIGPRSTENKGIIIGSIFGGLALVLVCMAIILYPMLFRRRARSRSPTPSARTASRLSKTCPSPPPHASTNLTTDIHTVRPVAPSPRRLAIDASAPTHRPFGMRWDAEKASVHTPLGHPAIVWRGNIFGSTTTNDDDAAEEPAERHGREPVPSVSSTFAAEMSSLLESISIKSSLSSLRSGGAVLGVPARLQTPLSVQKLRQDSCATTLGANKASVSDGEGVAPSVLARVPSLGSPRASLEKSENWVGKEHMPSGYFGEESMVGISVGSDCEVV